MVHLDMAIEKLYSQKEINERVDLIRKKEKQLREVALAEKIEKQKKQKELEDSGLARAIITKNPRKPAPIIEVAPKLKKKEKKKIEEVIIEEVVEEAIKEAIPEPTIEEQLEVITEVKDIVNNKKAELESQIAKLKTELEKEESE